MPQSLIISYYSPPFNSIASVRISRFAYWLPYYNWTPTILTARHDGETTRDLELPNNSSKNIRVGGNDPVKTIKAVVNNAIGSGSYHHSMGSIGSREHGKKLDFLKRINPVTNVRWPDIALWWQKKAINAGLRHIATNPTDIIFSSCGPPSSHIVASKIARITNIPWVADYRDLWTQNHMQKRNWSIQRLEEKFERHTMKKAAHFTTVSQDLSKRIQGLLSVNNRVSVVHNGFDDGLYERFVPDKSKKLTISYTGNIYPHQDPEPVISAIKRLKDLKVLSHQNVEVIFHGINLDQIKPLAVKFDVADIVKCKGSIPYQASLQRQIDSDILLLFGWQNTKEKGILTGKLFEYLGAKRPILCTGPGNDEMETIINETKTGRYCRDGREVFDALYEWSGQWIRKGAISFHPNDERTADYSRKRLTGKLANIFDSVLNEGTANSVK